MYNVTVNTIQAYQSLCLHCIVEKPTVFAYSTIFHHVQAPTALNYMIFKFTETQHGVHSYSVLEEVGVEVFVEPLGENDATLPPGHLERGGK